MAKIQGQGSDIVVDGLAEIARKQELAAKLAKLQDGAKKAAKSGDEQAKKAEAMRILSETRNPAILAETVRPANEGELVGGKPAKGWVVTICCQHGDCEKERLVNTQDAFQVRFCDEHKGEGRKSAGKERRAAAKVAKLSSLDEAELLAQIAALEGETEASETESAA